MTGAKPYSDLTYELIRGAYDTHIHAAPDGYERCVNYQEAAEEALALGMRGLVFKDHHFPTAHICWLLNRVYPQLHCIGSLTISHSCGGFNAEAVLRAAAIGIRIVWFPTLETAHFQALFGQTDYLAHLRTGAAPLPLAVLDQQGRILPEVMAVLETIRQLDLALGLGHLSPKETAAVVRAARGIGVEKIKLSHAQSRLAPPPEQQQELARQGVYLCYTFLNCLPGLGNLQPQELADLIRKVGPERVVLNTDAGQTTAPRPAELMLMTIEALLGCGIQATDIATMIRTNPAALFG